MSYHRASTCTHPSFVPRTFLGLIVVLAVVVSLAVAASGHAQTFAIGNDRQQEPEASDSAVAVRVFESWAERQRQFLGQPGVAVGVVLGDEWIVGGGFGDRIASSKATLDAPSSNRVTADTIFRLGSVSKTFTAFATLLARDDGKLRLKDPLSRHLPWFQIESTTLGGSGDITVWHLLTHTSGLPREAPLPYWTDRKFPDRQTLETMAPGIELLFEPGSNYQYSNLGISLLGAVVEAATGIPYETFIEERIYQPLGMASSSVSNEDIDLDRLAAGYLIADAGSDRLPLAPDTRAEAITPAANLSSTVRDLAAYLRAQFPGRGYGPMSARTQREMQRAHWLSSSWRSARGLGFSLWRRGERTLVGHGGWVAGHRSQIAFDPSAEVGVVVLTSSDQGGPASYTDQLFDYLVPALERDRASESSQAIKPELDAFVGRYRDPWGAHTEVFSNGRELLVYEHSYPPTDNLAGAVERVEHVSGSEFRFPGLRKKPLVFEMGDDGRVARVRTGVNYLFPLGCELRYEELRCD